MGYIDPQCPHAINTLTIGELGEEEVLVSAHDDGDVCVWYTRDLSRMALRENVGESAWGVAIHKEKRLLAVSANTHDITVFELGVGRCGIREEEDEEKEREVGKDVLARRMEAVPPESSCHGETRKRMAGDEAGRVCGRPRASSAVNGHKRRKEKKAARKDKSVKVLKGHSHNIPSISFLDDSSGRWLAGTSIDGVVILWDVHTQRMVEKCHFDIRASVLSHGSHI